jgi:hypothetical protein
LSFKNLTAEKPGESSCQKALTGRMLSGRGTSFSDARGDKCSPGWESKEGLTNASGQKLACILKKKPCAWPLAVGSWKIEPAKRC